jgi:chaperone BCS1
MEVNEKTKIEDSSSSTHNGLLTPPPSTTFTPTKNSTDLAEMFASAIPEDTVAVSSIQAYLLRFKRRPEEAVAGVEGWVKNGFEQTTVSAF